MKISISNIAWNPEEDEKILHVLRKYGVNGIEVAPTKIWKNPISESKESIKSYKNFWKKNGVDIIATQSVLFGHPELTLFEDRKTREDTLKYLMKMISVCKALGSRVIVFGSPMNRSRKGLGLKESLEISYEFFEELGKYSEKNEMYFCIEPNPKEYGTDFINSSEEAMDLVKAVSSPGFRLHLDTGAMYMNNENYEESIEKGIEYLKHFHISEKNLEMIGSTKIPHKDIAHSLKILKYKNWVSIEMRMKNKTGNDIMVDKALRIVVQDYS